MYCCKCGKKFHDNDIKFCSSCGSSVDHGADEADAPSFHQFMELRSKFEAAKQSKEKERTGHFKKGRKKGDEPVKINVGLVDLVDSNPPELKIRRASNLPVTVKKSDSALTVTQLAVQKHLAHNQTLRRDADVEWILLYPDMDVVLYVPGTTELFYVEGYKDSLGKPYNRINLYLCKKTDYNAFLIDPEDSTASEGTANEFLSSSGEISFIIPENTDTSEVHDNNVLCGNGLSASANYQVSRRSSSTSRHLRNDTSVGFGPSRLTEQSTCGELNGTTDIAQPSASNSSVYTQYCNLIDSATEIDLEESPHPEDNPEMQEVLMQSVFHESKERVPIQSLLKKYQGEKEGNSEDDYQIIRVRRKHLWEDTMRAVSKKSFRRNVHLKIHFIGEDAEDEGGPLREFFRLALQAIVAESGLMEGSDNRKIFTNNPMLLNKRAYYCAGLIVASSLQQGGPPMSCFASSVYDYFHSGTSGCMPTLLDVSDVDARSKIGKFIYAGNEESFQKSLKEEAEFILEAGITKVNWKLEDKDELASLLCKCHVIYNSKAAIDQFLEGLETTGFLKYIKENPYSLKEIFCVSNSADSLNISAFRKLLHAHLTNPGSNEANQLREDEEATLLWWEEFLDNIENSDPEGLLVQLLVFITGADKIPIMGFHKPVDIYFYQYESGVKRFPTASTCDLSLYLPRGIQSYDEFHDLIVQAIKEGSYGFGCI